MKSGNDILRALYQRRRWLTLLAKFQTGTARRVTLKELDKIDIALYKLGIDTDVQPFETR